MPVDRINGFDMAYDVTGNGPAVAFIHGGFGGIAGRLELARHWWADEVLAPHCRVITYDRRGCGRSEMPADGYDMETFAADLGGLLEHLGVERSYIIGSSAGGPVAMQYALDYPERVSGLVLVNTAADLLIGELARPLRDRLARQRAAGPDALPELQEGADAAAYEATMRTRELIRQLPAEERARAFDSWDRTVRAYESLDLTSQLHRLQMPAYILHGREDEVVPFASAYKLSNSIARSEARIMAGERHGLMSRRESGAAELVREWLLKREAQSGSS